MNEGSSPDRMEHEELFVDAVGSRKPSTTPRASSTQKDNNYESSLHRDSFTGVELSLVDLDAVQILRSRPNSRKMCARRMFNLSVMLGFLLASCSGVLIFTSKLLLSRQEDSSDSVNHHAIPKDESEESLPTVMPTTLQPSSTPTAAPTSAPTQKVLDWKDFTGLLINVGSESVHIDSRGNEWVGDVNGTISSSGFSVSRPDCEESTIGNAIDYELFCTGRVQQPSFHITEVPNGPYVVTVHFIYTTNSRSRFDVFINKLRVYREFQSKFVEPFTAQSIEALVEVDDEHLLIDFWQLREAPQIAAIEVHRASGVHGGASANLTYIPGLLSMQQSGLILSEGLQAKRIAKSKQRVKYANGELSRDRFHEMPDAASTFLDTREENEGGWIYVSNAEVRPYAGNGRPGGVGAITFNKNGDIIEYRRLLNKTRANCGGGRTPWNTWVSCEEIDTGRIYQVDPLGNRPPERITMGETYPGKYESFAYDDRDPQQPRFFVTKDDENGELRRFTPAVSDWENDPWSMLTGEGTLEFLVLIPSPDDPGSGTFEWSLSRAEGSSSALKYFPNSEGIDVFDNELMFVSKVKKRLVILDLDKATFVYRTTKSGLMEGQPDQIHKVSGINHNIIYFTEDGGQYAGIHGRGFDGQFFTIVESHRYSDETTGMSFSPDYKHLYLAYQDNGLLFDVTRVDGLSFQATPLNIKFHNPKFSLSIR